MISPSTKRAFGVIFKRGLRKHRVYANCEIILSAGAIQSPQLLMLSGVGPKKHLKKIRIPLIQDLPGVGRNLQDHVAIGGITYLIDPPHNVKESDGFAFVLPKSLTLDSVRDFTLNRTGPLYMVPQSEAMAFINTK